MTEKKKLATEFHDQANELLESLADARDTQKKINADLEDCLLGVRLAFAQKVENSEISIKQLETDIKKLAKKQHSELFEAGTSVRTDLPAGALLYSLIEKVRHAKTITPELLEQLGYEEAVKISKSVDWDAIEKWPDAKLVEIGTERNAKNNYEYELAENKKTLTTEDAEDAERK